MRYGIARGVYANEAGYGTAAFVASRVLDRRFGLDRGFEGEVGDEQRHREPHTGERAGADDVPPPDAGGQVGVDLRHRAADDLVVEFVLGIGRQRLEAQPHVAVLPAAAALLLVAILTTGFACNSFTIWNTRLMNDKPHLKFSLSAVQCHINMLVTHALQNSLMRDGIVLPRQGHILFAHAGQRGRNFRCIGLGLGSDCHTI